MPIITIRKLITYFHIMSKNYLFKENVVLLANGDFPKHEAAIEKLNNSTYIICCDGSANSLVQFGKTPDIIIYC